jgi:hypothetical protein
MVEVIWSPLAIKTYDAIIEYLLEKFYAVVGVLLSSCVAAAPTMNNSSLIIIA